MLGICVHSTFKDPSHNLLCGRNRWEGTSLPSNHLSSSWWQTYAHPFFFACVMHVLSQLPGQGMYVPSLMLLHPSPFQGGGEFPSLQFLPLTLWTLVIFQGQMDEGLLFNYFLLVNWHSPTYPLVQRSLTKGGL